MGIFDSMANIGMQQQTNFQNLALTHQSWERDDSAVQRRTADLKAAGLNPVLAAGQAATNSNPIAAQSPRVQDTLGSSVRTFKDVLRSKSELDILKSQADAERENALLAGVRKNQAIHDYNWYVTSHTPSGSASGLSGDILKLASYVTGALEKLGQGFKNPITEIGTKAKNGIQNVHDKIGSVVDQAILDLGERLESSTQGATVPKAVIPGRTRTPVKKESSPTKGRTRG